MEAESPDRVFEVNRVQHATVELDVIVPQVAEVHRGVCSFDMQMQALQQGKPGEGQCMQK